MNYKHAHTKCLDKNMTKIGGNIEIAHKNYEKIGLRIEKKTVVKKT